MAEADIPATASSINTAPVTGLGISSKFVGLVSGDATVGRTTPERAGSDERQLARGITRGHLSQKQDGKNGGRPYRRACQRSGRVDCSQNCRCRTRKETEGLATERAKLLNLKGINIGYLPEIRVAQGG
jgi:hypothetical protein